MGGVRVVVALPDDLLSPGWGGGGGRLLMLLMATAVVVLGVGGAAVIMRVLGVRAAAAAVPLGGVLGSGGVRVGVLPAAVLLSVLDVSVVVLLAVLDVGVVVLVLAGGGVLLPLAAAVVVERLRPVVVRGIDVVGAVLGVERVAGVVLVKVVVIGVI